MRKLFILLLCPLCLSILSFKDNESFKYKKIYPNVIERIDGAKYEAGKINLKFKEDLKNAGSVTTGIASIDGIINNYSVSRVIQKFPLKKDISKRVYGDQELAKVYQIVYTSDIDPTELSEAILHSNRDVIDWVEPAFVYVADFIPNDPLHLSQYHISRVNCYQAWDITQGDTNVFVGIVDSGSDLDHPDLATNIRYNYAEIPNNNIDDDNNGYIDDFMGWDFYYADNDPNINGGSDHGSHVSGCASQVTNNNVHGSGAGFKVKIRITKHAPDTPGNLIFDGPSGVTYHYQNGAKAINCSFGGGTFSAFFQQVVTNAWNAGSMVLGSAGNEGQNIPRYPGSYDNVISVAATTQADLKAGFSNYHSTVDISAPGQGILSTLYNNGYATFDGTSMSTPITAGVVGLIRSRYPSWTNQQTLDRLLLGVDSIYNLNPQYIGMLGTGRVNAFKCVSDLPIVSILSNNPSDSLYGNNDRVFDIDEPVTLALAYKNTWLSGNNVSLRIATTDPNVEILQDSVYVGNLAAYTTYNTSHSNTFRVKAKNICPYDRVVTFTLSTSNNAYIDNNTRNFTVTFRQGWATHTINNLKLSVTKDGAVGKKTQNYGGGLNIPTYAANNHILEGGLMIGVSNTKVSDVCRRGNVPANVSDTDFTALNTYQLTRPGTSSNEDGKGLFNDDGAGSNKIGVTVRAESFAWSSTNDANYIIFRYTIKNTSSANITNMFAGIYMYYIPNGTNGNNITSLDTVNKIGYSYNTTTTNPYLGVSLLSSQNLNFKALNSSEVLTGFTTQEKWDAMSNGIVNGSIGPGTNCFVISAGAINLNVNDSVTVGFAVVKGNDLPELITNSNTARSRFNVIGIEQISTIVPEKFALYQNYPNPFNPSTTIKFDIAKAGDVNIKVFDVIGRQVSNVLSQKLDAGQYRLDFDGSNYASGVYFYRIEAQGFTDVKKMILVK